MKNVSLYFQMLDVVRGYMKDYKNTYVNDAVTLKDALINLVYGLGYVTFLIILMVM